MVQPARHLLLPIFVRTLISPFGHVGNCCLHRNADSDSVAPDCSASLIGLLVSIVEGIPKAQPEGYRLLAHLTCRELNFDRHLSLIGFSRLQFDFPHGVLYAVHLMEIDLRIVGNPLGWKSTSPRLQLFFSCARVANCNDDPKGLLVLDLRLVDFNLNAEGLILSPHKLRRKAKQ